MAYMQYWLLNYGGNCSTLPGKWQTSGSSCYKNSVDAVPAPSTAPIGQLSQLKLSGSVTSKGKDTLILTDGTRSIAMGLDSVLGLASGWNESEFNNQRQDFGEQCNDGCANLHWPDFD